LTSYSSYGIIYIEKERRKKMNRNKMTIKDFYNLFIKHYTSDWEINLDEIKNNIRMIEFWGITEKIQLNEYWDKEVVDWEITTSYNDDVEFYIVCQERKEK
jgi:hypothetical protein